MRSTESALRRYVTLIALAALAGAVGVVVVGGDPTSDGLLAAFLFGVFGLLAHAMSHQSSPGRGGSIGFLPFLCAVTLTPTWAAAAVVVVAVTIGELLVPRQWLKRIFNISQLLLSVSLAILSYRWLGGESAITTQARAVPFVAMFVCYMVVNKLAVGTVVGLAGRQPLHKSILTSLTSTVAYDILSLPLVFLFSSAYVRAGPGWSAALALPLLGVRQLYKSNSELELINEELLQLMVAAIEARDPYTSGHSQRVARYSRVIARLLGLSSRKVESIGTAALLHDVGKIHEEFAPLLRKPERLTDAEYTIMKTHSAKGAVLVAKVSRFRDLVPAIRGHHEAWSGRGYPDALAGDEIPLGARIITIADTIDAMTTVRPYRPPRTLQEVRVEIERVGGTQFDPRICASVLSEQNWRELTLEVEIAAREFPAEYVGSEFTSDEIPRHSTQFRVH
ncbi:MAG: HD-GYP domain-containing protein [Gemmatimonadaceae bacterium]